MPKLSKGSRTVVVPCFNPSFSGPHVVILLRQDVFSKVNTTVKTYTRVHIYEWGEMLWKHVWELFFSLCKVSEREPSNVCYKLMGAFQLESFYNFINFINCQNCSERRKQFWEAPLHQFPAIRPAGWMCLSGTRWKCEHTERPCFLDTKTQVKESHSWLWASHSTSVLLDTEAQTSFPRSLGHSFSHSNFSLPADIFWHSMCHAGAWQQSAPTLCWCSHPLQARTNSSG